MIPAVKTRNGAVVFAAKRDDAEHVLNDHFNKDHVIGYVDPFKLMNALFDPKNAVDAFVTRKEALKNLLEDGCVVTRSFMGEMIEVKPGGELLETDNVEFAP